MISKDLRGCDTVTAGVNFSDNGFPIVILIAVQGNISQNYVTLDVAMALIESLTTAVTTYKKLKGEKV